MSRTITTKFQDLAAAFRVDMGTLSGPEFDARIKELADAGISENVELTPYFTMVSDPEDWKRPIDAVIPKSAQAKVARAIVYFTATEPTFHTVPNDAFRLRVCADGYRRGPAGDH